MSRKRKRKRKRKLNPLMKEKEMSAHDREHGTPVGVQYSPFGTEVYFANQKPDDGDFFKDMKGVIIAIFDNSRWHEVLMDDETGEYWATGATYKDLMDLIEEEAKWMDDTLAITKQEDDDDHLPWWERMREDTPAKSGVKVVKKNSKYAGRVIIEETGTAYETWRTLIIDDLKKHFEFKVGKYHSKWELPDSMDPTVPTAIIPINRCGWKRTAPFVQTCGFEGAKQYLASILGRGLDDADKDWYKYHHGTDSHGVPLMWVPTVLQQLVEPYGISVSRIRLRLGQYNAFEDRAAWIASLGINPQAMHDSEYTNAKYAEANSMDLEEVNGLWRIDYGDELLTPSVTAFEFVANASGGGHVEYIGPRGGKWKSRTWNISVQFDYADRVQHWVPLNLTPYKEKDDAYELDWEGFLDAEGKKICKGYITSSRSGGSVTTTPSSTDKKRNGWGTDHSQYGLF
jgi:hypothetical protein